MRASPDPAYTLNHLSVCVLSASVSTFVSLIVLLYARFADSCVCSKLCLHVSACCVSLYSRYLIVLLHVSTVHPCVLSKFHSCSFNMRVTPTPASTNVVYITFFSSTIFFVGVERQLYVVYTKSQICVTRICIYVYTCKQICKM